jgi:indole-3-glycerol phosphate synthase
MPKRNIIVTESESHTPDNVNVMQRRQVNAFLVGEALCEQTTQTLNLNIYSSA